MKNNSEHDNHCSCFFRIVTNIKEEQENEQSLDNILVLYSSIEILERRHRTGSDQGPRNIPNDDAKNSLAQEEVIKRLVVLHNLSRRQAQVALKCAEGFSNAEISKKLFIKQVTVKFHLRNIFIKLGVKRRTELISYLFRQEITRLISSN